MNTIENISIPTTKPRIDFTIIIGFMVTLAILVRYIVNVLPEVKNMSSGEINFSTSQVLEK